MTPRDTNELITTLESNAGQLPVLGFMVYWTLQQVREPDAKAKADWKDAGLDEAFTPKAPSDVGAYKRASRTAIRTMTEATSGVQIKRAVMNSERIEDVVYRYKPVVGLDDVVRHKFTESARVTFWRATGNADVDGDASDAAAQAVLQQYGHHRGHVTTHDGTLCVGEAVKRMLGGVALRSTGGIYFIPSERVDELEALQSVVERWGDSELYMVPLYDTSEARRGVKASATASFRAELERVRSEASAYRERLEDADEGNPRQRPSRSGWRCCWTSWGAGRCSRTCWS